MSTQTRSGPGLVAGPDPAAIRAALDAVIDPELDESVLVLGFVDALHIDGDRVSVQLRLPTFWCAPNFAYLMVRDARDRLLEVKGVRDAQVTLKDHFAADVLSSAGGEGRTFEETFPGEAGGNLDALRALFRRKAFTRRQERLVRMLLEARLTEAQIAGLRLADLDCSGQDLLISSPAMRLSGGAETYRTYLARRREFGLPEDLSAPLITDPAGRAIACEELGRAMRAARRQRISTEFNAALCRGLLATRYGSAEGKAIGPTEIARRET